MTQWEIDPDTWNLVGDTERQFTASEFAKQEWPACPNCGTTLDVSPIHAPDGNSRDVYIIGRMRCPRGCSPRQQ